MLVRHMCDTRVAPENPLKNNLEWSDHGENLSECSTHVLSKCTNFGDDPISLRVRKRQISKNQNTCFLVGTWRDATWAIRFYEKFGFILQTEKRAVQLLKKYWKISSNQIDNSVVLIK
mgnify:CR=1 FL=1